MSQTLAADESKLAPPVRTRKGTNEGFLSDAVVRSRVVLEIMNTERDYVKNLEDMVEVRVELICCVKNLKVHKKWEGDDVNLKYGQPPPPCAPGLALHRL